MTDEKEQCTGRAGTIRCVFMMGHEGNHSMILPSKTPSKTPPLVNPVRWPTCGAVYKLTSMCALNEGHYGHHVTSSGAPWHGENFEDPPDPYPYPEPLVGPLDQLASKVIGAVTSCLSRAGCYLDDLRTPTMLAEVTEVLRNHGKPKPAPKRGYIDDDGCVQYFDKLQEGTFQVVKHEKYSEIEIIHFMDGYVTGTFVLHDDVHQAITDVYMDKIAAAVSG